MESGTAYKVCLSKDQWASVCDFDEEIAAEVAKQQPELAAELGFELVTSVQRSIKRKDVTGEAEAEGSPVSDSNADEAIASIAKMRSKDKLQHIIDNDQRVTVKEAAQDRLAAL